jgi:NTE family protein
VGALDGTVIAARPDSRGGDLLRQLWLSKHAREVFRVRPLGAVGLIAGCLGILSPDPVRSLIQQFESTTGCTEFKDLKIPMRVVATDLVAGCPVVISSGQLAPALMASTAIPGVFPPVALGSRVFSDGGIVENVPLTLAVREAFARILAVGVMAGGELRDPPASWTEVIARTLQLSLHQRLLSDFQRLRTKARVVVICPITPPEAALEMRLSHVEGLIERARIAASHLLARTGKGLFDRSAIHYIDLRDDTAAGAATAGLADAV